MNERILIVDDDEEALNLVGMILKRRGYEPIKVQSGQKALEFLSHSLPDLIILDVMMPEMDGKDVCRQIRADSRMTNIPIVMLTARSETANQIEGLLAGADDYLVKPVGSEELLTSVQAALARAANAPIMKTAQVISILGARGGVGATTLAVNLAVALASRMRTVLIDLEAEGTAAIHLGLSPTCGLGDLLLYPADAIDMDSIENSLSLHSSGLNLLAAASLPMDVARAAMILGELRQVYDVCVLDLGTGLTPIVQAIAPHSHPLILALDADRVTLAQAEHMIKGIGEAGSVLPELKLVRINRLGTPDDAALEAIQLALGKRASVLGPAPDAMYQCLERGEPLVLSQPAHPVAAQIHALAASLVGTA
jgi:DNA-binding response OmpR family regulator